MLTYIGCYLPLSDGVSPTYLLFGSRIVCTDYNTMATEDNSICVERGEGASLYLLFRVQEVCALGQIEILLVR